MLTSEENNNRFWLQQRVTDSEITLTEQLLKIGAVNVFKKACKIQVIPCVSSAPPKIDTFKLKCCRTAFDIHAMVQCREYIMQQSQAIKCKFSFILVIWTIIVICFSQSLSFVASCMKMNNNIISTAIVNGAKIAAVLMKTRYLLWTRLRFRLFLHPFGVGKTRISKYMHRN